MLQVLSKENNKMRSNIAGLMKIFLPIYFNGDHFTSLTVQLSPSHITSTGSINNPTWVFLF